MKAVVGALGVNWGRFYDGTSTEWEAQLAWKPGRHFSASTAYQRTDIRLPAGASCLHKVAVTTDGKWLYAVHTVGRTNLPTTQLERGWMNTNALSIVRTADAKPVNTVLLDSVDLITGVSGGRPNRFSREAASQAVRSSGP